MRRSRALVFAGITLTILVIAAILMLSGSRQSSGTATGTLSQTDSLSLSTQALSYGLQTGLPARATKTPVASDSPHTALIVPTAQASPVVTSPFSFPTGAPADSTTSAADCTAVFPVESIEAIRFGQTTTAQLEAAFGHAVSVGGRPPTYRFEASGCVLAVSTDCTIAQEAELSAYGTLDWLLDRYGPPTVVGISEGNLVLMIPGQAVLLYPEQGLIATFDALPDDLTRETPLAVLYARPSYEASRQITRLKLAVVDDWVPPLR